MRVVKGILYSLLIALWVEFFYKFGATYDPDNFFGALIIYPAYIALLFGLFRLCKINSKLMIFVISGLFGLMIEWFLIGNSPWGNPQALQLGMFVFHALYPVYGYLYIQNRLSEKEHRFLFLLFLGFTLLLSAGFFIPRGDTRFILFILTPLMPYFIASGRFLWMIFLDFRKKRT